MKKLLTSLCVLVLALVCIFALPTTAQAATEGNYVYTVSNNEATIFDYIGSSNNITIPSKLGGYPVTTIGDYAFFGCQSLISVTIPGSVTTIGADAFYCCFSLINVSIPEGVTTIGDYAFSSCESLISITIPDSVTTIGDDAFSYCEKLTGILVSEGNRNYSSNSKGVLYNKNKTSLLRAPGGMTGSYTIPDSVTTIGGSAFSGCDSLTSITIPDSVTTIGEYAFSGCTGLVYNTYDNAKYLGNSANPYLALIEVTSSDVTSVDVNNDTMVICCSAFYSCNKLTGIWVSEGNGNYSSNSKGVLYNKNKTSLLRAPGGMTGSYTIPDSVTTIGGSAFSGCDSLTSVTIPDSVTTIGDYAFEECYSLTSVTIPDSVTTIGERAFAWCDMTSVTIPDNVTSIGNGAFDYCTSLTGIWVSEGNRNYSSDNKGVLFNKDKTILLRAPLGITGGYSVPDTVTTINDDAFSFCGSLTSVIIPDTVTTIGGGAFTACSRLDSANIPNSLGIIEGWTFYHCDSLTSISIPASVTIIGDSAFICPIVVHYAGTEEQWKAVAIGTENFLEADIRFHIHSYTKKVTAPTCTAKGYTTYICACKDTYKANYTSATGHSYDAGKVTKAATCKAAGVRTYTCKVCKATKTTAIAKLTKHTYTNNCDTTCNVCGAKRTIKHTYSNNCDTACNVCKAKRTIKHSYKTTTTKATLTKNGKIVKKCTVCGKVASTTTIKRVKTVKLSATSYTYNGKAKTPTVTVKDSAGKTLKKNTDYTVTYASGRKNVGTYKVTVKMKGKYTGTKTLTFKILPKVASINKLTAKSKAIAVKLNRVTTQSTGYQIQYSTSSKFTSAKTVNVTSYKTSSKTISGLKKGKKYYVRVRTYKTVGKTKFYSAWSSYKSVKTK